ncbi:MAG: hypothetical protein COC01_04560 [Bacteroidetes bacterium]|nr:MAG: hypothetical protein COC01_04560 [Bacteroidota bacterium]
MNLIFRNKPLVKKPINQVVMKRGGVLFACLFLLSQIIYGQGAAKYGKAPQNLGVVQIKVKYLDKPNFTDGIYKDDAGKPHVVYGDREEALEKLSVKSNEMNSADGIDNGRRMPEVVYIWEDNYSEEYKPINNNKEKAKITSEETIRFDVLKGREVLSE